MSQEIKQDERQLLMEIIDQNSRMLVRLARLEEMVGAPVASGLDDDLSLNLSAMERADDPIKYLRDRNRKIKQRGKLRKRAD